MGFILRLVDFMQRLNVSGCQKKVLKTNGYGTSNKFGDVNVSAQNRNFSFLLFSDKNNIMPVMQKLKFRNSLLSSM